jgi:hypothetical protein
MTEQELQKLIEDEDDYINKWRASLTIEQINSI